MQTVFLTTGPSSENMVMILGEHAATASGFQTFSHALPAAHSCRQSHSHLGHLFQFSPVRFTIKRWIHALKEAQVSNTNGLFKFIQLADIQGRTYTLNPMQVVYYRDMGNGQWEIMLPNGHSLKTTTDLKSLFLSAGIPQPV